MSETGGVPKIALRPKSAAAAIEMSERWLMDSDIPRVKLGASVVFLVADLTAYLEARRSHAKAA